MKDRLGQALKSIRASLQNGRTRLILLLVVVIVIFGIVIGIYKLTSGPSDDTGSQVAGVPSSIQSVPAGGNESQAYLQTLLQSNRQAAQQALATGQSSVATIAQNPGDQTGDDYTSQAVKSQCCCCDKNGQGGAGSQQAAGALVNTLESSGAITPAVASELRKLSDQGVSTDDYANALKQMVADGKLTPAQAKALLDAYKTEQNAATQTPGQLANTLLASGKLDTQTAQAIKDLDAKNLTPDQYAAALNGLVKQGKLSPEDAQKFMAAYQKQQASSDTPAGITSALQGSGAIDGATADQLRQLNAQGISPDGYAAALNKLVRDGKLSPAQAQRLMAAYNKGYGQSAVTTSPDDVVSALQNSGAIDQSTANALQKLNSAGLSSDDYADGLNDLVKQGKLTSAQAQRLLSAYNAAQTATSNGGGDQITTPTPDALASQMASAGQISPQTMSQLRQLNASGVSPQAYKGQLQQMADNGQLTQAQVDKLATAYAQHKLSAAAGDTSTGMLDQLQANGSIDPQAANQLKSMLKSNVTPEAYANALKSLVTSGQLDPATAAKLLQNYINTQSAKLQSGKGIAGLQDQQRLQDLQQQVEAFNQQASEEQQKANDETKKMLEQMESSMGGQVSQLVASWKAPSQDMVSSNQDNKNLNANNGGNGGGSGAGAGVTPVMIKAGTILFAVLDTKVNSDRPGPVMATIVAGKYKGAKLLGSLQVTPDYERVILSFNMMSMRQWPETVPIKSVAINPDTAQTAIASDVDHHYLLRYSALFASAFLQGYAQAVQNSGSTQVNSFGTVSQTFNKTDTLDKVMIGLGQVGQNAGQAAADTFNRKPTITVDSGVGLGVLFTGNVNQPGSSDTKQTKEQDSNGS